jgi:hypothetical protein
MKTFSPPYGNGCYLNIRDISISRNSPFFQGLNFNSKPQTQTNYNLAVFCYVVWGICLACVAQIVGYAVKKR